MKASIIGAASFLLLFVAACNSEDKSPKVDVSADHLNAADRFIRSSLDGNLSRAREMILDDSLNDQYFAAYERNYSSWSPDIRQGYRESTIRIFDNRKLNDSTAEVVYSNSYMNKKDTLRLVKKSNKWLVDLKYLFQPTVDTLNTSMDQSKEPK